MKRSLLVGIGIVAIIAVLGTGLFYMLQPYKIESSFFGNGTIADMQNLMSEIPTLQEYSERDPEELRALGFNSAELKESLKTKQKLLQTGIQKLLSDGADVGQLIGTAYIYRQYDILDLLLASGVDINTPYQSGGATVLDMAAMKGDLDMLKFFIEHGADVNGIDAAGIPVLQTAVMGGLDTVKLLIEHGADVTKNNSTLLHFAVLMNKEDIVRIFLKHGASVHTIDKLGRTPLFYTTYAFIGDQEITPPDNRRAIVELLIAHNADIMARDHYNETPLHAAALWGSYAVLESFIDHGADIEAQDARGFTPLFMAALGSGKTKNSTFSILMTHQAKVDHIAKNGTTVLHVAMRPDIAQVAFDMGIGVNVQDNTGLTPLDYASGSDRNLLYALSYLGVIPYNLFSNDEIRNFLKQHGGYLSV